MELSKSRFNLYCSLSTAKMRRRHGLFTAEGEKCVADMLGSYRLDALICVNGYLPPFNTSGITLYNVTEEAMRKLSNLSTHSPVMAVFYLPAESDLDLKVKEEIYLALDGVQDPGNLGTIIRTCHWFGVFRIFASHDTADAFNPKTVQAAMGSLGKVRVTYCDLPELFAANPAMPVVGTLLNGNNIFRASLPAKGFIVMGNEGNGLSDTVRKLVDMPLLIPPKCSDNHSESLNVSIATAIVLAAFQR